MIVTMTVQGVLGDDGCADVFQLLGRQKKNGLLCLRSRLSSVDIWMRGGLVLRVEDLARQDRHRLGEMLCSAGLVTPDALAHALAEQRRARRRIGELLVKAGAVTAQDLSTIIRLQARETLFNAFFLRRGTYQFTPGRLTNPSVELDAGLKWEDVMLEVGQRMAEMPAIHETIPNQDSEVRALAPLTDQLVPPAGDEEMLLEEKTGQQGVPAPRQRPVDFPDANDRTVFAVLQGGPLSAWEACARSRLGEFAALRSLWRLALEGHVAVSSTHLEELPEADAEELVGDDTAQRGLYASGDDTKPTE